MVKPIAAASTTAFNPATISSAVAVPSET